MQLLETKVQEARQEYPQLEVLQLRDKNTPLLQQQDQNVRDQYDQVRELLQLTFQKHECNLLLP